MKFSEVAFSFLTNARIELALSAHSQILKSYPTHDLIPINHNELPLPQQSGAMYMFLCSWRQWDQSSWLQWKWWVSLTSSNRRRFVVMNVSPLWAQRYILSQSNNKGIVQEDAETGPIVDCADGRIMFARLFGQNFMSHALRNEVDVQRVFGGLKEMYNKFMVFSLALSFGVMTPFWLSTNHWMNCHEMFQCRVQIMLPFQISCYSPNHHVVYIYSFGGKCFQQLMDTHKKTSRFPVREKSNNFGLFFKLAP